MASYNLAVTLSSVSKNNWARNFIRIHEQWAFIDHMVTSTRVQDELVVTFFNLPRVKGRRKARRVWGLRLIISVPCHQKWCTVRTSFPFITRILPLPIVVALHRTESRMCLISLHLNMTYIEGSLRRRVTCSVLCQSPDIDRRASCVQCGILRKQRSRRLRWLNAWHCMQCENFRGCNDQNLLQVFVRAFHIILRDCPVRLLDSEKHTHLVHVAIWPDSSL